MSLKSNKTCSDSRLCRVELLAGCQRDAAGGVGEVGAGRGIEHGARAVDGDRRIGPPARLHGGLGVAALGAHDALVLVSGALRVLADKRQTGQRLSTHRWRQSQ